VERQRTKAGHEGPYLEGLKEENDVSELACQENDIWNTVLKVF